MATTIKISDSINWSMSFGGWKKLNIGTANEPAITSANLILQTIIGPPFTWNWNRANASFLTTVGVQDYVQTLATFGFIEKASYIPAATITNTALTSNIATYTAVNDFLAGDKVTVTGSTNGAGVFNVTNATIVSASAASFTVAIVSGNVGTASDTGTAISGTYGEVPNITNILGTGNELGPPSFLSPQVDSNNGDITFRILPLPDRIYQVNVVFQKKIPRVLNSTNQTWAPIPDQYSYIYNPGFLALAMAYWNDARWSTFNAKFIGALLGAAEGLSEVHKNLFMTNWLASITEQQNAGIKTQQGSQARGT